MIRSILRSCGRLLAAIVLLALLVCAGEVLLRALRLNKNASLSRTQTVEPVTAPSQTTYVDVIPLQNFTITTSAGDQKVCRTNEYGIRGESIIVPKPRETFRVLCLGSDDTFGLGADQRHTFCQRLQEYLQPMTSMKVEVINAGCPTAGPLVNYLRYRQRFAGLQSDLVIMNLKAEDLYLDQKVRGTVRTDSDQKPSFATHPKFLAKGSQLVDEACQEFILANWTVDHLGGLIGVNAPRSERSQMSSLDLKHSDMEPVLLMHQIVTTHFGGLLVSISPSPWSLQPAAGVSGSLTTRSLESDLSNTLKQAQLSQSVPVHNSSDIFQNSPDLKYLFSAHSGLLSAQGHDLYARSLARFVIQSVPNIWNATPNTTQSPSPTQSPYFDHPPIEPATLRQPQTSSQLRPTPQAESIIRERQ